MAKSTKNNSRQLISFDWAMKRLLRNKSNFGILEGFLSTLLRQDIELVEILDPETNMSAATEKRVIVDLLCKTTTDALVLIEIQYGAEPDYFQRMLYGVSKIISERLNRGEAYAKIVKLYSVNLVWFDLGSGLDYVYHGTTTFKGLHHGDELALNPIIQNRFSSQTPKELYPEYFILKVNKFDSVAKSPLDEWLYYFKNESLPKKFRAKGLSLLAEQLKVTSMRAQDLEVYKKYKDQLLVSESSLQYALDRGEDIGIKKGLEQGIERGIKQGETQKIEQTILSAVQKGLSMDLIAEILDVPKETVRRVIDKK
jgi:predicted transposase/invertase (TIGR01784 family)